MNSGASLSPDWRGGSVAREGTFYPLTLTNPRESGRRVARPSQQVCFAEGVI
jgi:hypothetical protein